MIPRCTWQRIVSVAGVCLVGYFLYHTVEGERGWLAQHRLQRETVKAEKTLVTLQKEREMIERRVRLMRPESLDPDLLDEEVRKSLNYSKDGEIVIILPTEQEAKDAQAEKED